MTDLRGANCAVFYVNGLTGSDDNDGSGWTSGSAFATVQKAFDKIADGTINDGDEVRICGGSGITYGIGTALNPAWDTKEVTITGANADGMVDNTQARLIATASIGSILDMDATECERATWAHIYFDGAGVATNCLNSAANNHYQQFVNCRFSNATSHGVYKLSNYWNFINCRFDNNGGDGMRMDSTSFGFTYKCLFDNNASCGVDMGTENAFRNAYIECVFHNNRTKGIILNGSYGVVCNSIFDSNTEEGLQDRGTTIQTLRIGNIYSNNGYGGVNYYGNTDSVGFNELFYNNRNDTEDDGADAEAIGPLGHMINYVAGASGQNPNYLNGTGPTFDFTSGPTFGGKGFGIPTPYAWFGTTADDVGLNKWVNTETISIF